MKQNQNVSNILIISGHPNLEDSYANKLILDRLEASDLNTHIRYLDRIYANGACDVAQEQAHMRAADIIVFQFPLYWYAVPAIMKQWMEDVYTFGFAFGPDGSQLRGKKFIASVTVGGSAEKYKSAEIKENCKSIASFLKPVTELAKFSAMVPQEIIYTFQMAYIKGVHEHENAVLDRAESHAEKLITAIKSAL